MSLFACYSPMVLLIAKMLYLPAHDYPSEKKQAKHFPKQKKMKHFQSYFDLLSTVRGFDTVRENFGVE